MRGVDWSIVAVGLVIGATIAWMYKRRGASGKGGM